MILYQATKAEFRGHVRDNQIDSRILAGFRRHLGHGTGKSEIDSWKNSMMYMSQVLEDDGIPADSGVAIEYRIPQTSKRVDFIVTGRNQNRRGAAVIVELKQWSAVEETAKDGVVRTFVGHTVREVSHPSYQAWTYAALLNDFNENVQKQGIDLRPCAYLHNLESADVIASPHYAQHTDKAPAFIRSDAARLTAFIKQHIRHGDGGRLMYEIENSRIRPSKNLADELEGMLKGHEAFVMIDDQKVVFETALALARSATVKDKRVLIIEGGPGTGKSVVAINLLVRLIAERLTTQYVTRNAAPRAVYESVLVRSFRKSHISNLFSGSGAYTETEPNSFDALVVDEAHRLNEKSGMYKNLGEHQVKEIIDAAKCSIFFIDEDQRIAWRDVGTIDEIERWADLAGATAYRMKLQSQFRCNGSDGYLAWLDHVLQIRPTANDDLAGIHYDFRVCDTPNELMELIEAKNAERNKARAVAGYCWDWITKKPDRRHEFDIDFPGHDFRRRWNLDTDGSLWIRKPGSVKEIGCIHTCQGLEVDYVGVIIGPDLVVRDRNVVTRPDQRSRMDATINGYKKALKSDPAAARERIDRIIKNTYRTLMSRGQRGCYLYCTDPETQTYFKELAQIIQRVAPQSTATAAPTLATPHRSERYPNLTLRILPSGEVRPFENSVPIYDMAAAAGGFTYQEIADRDWVELPDSFQPRPDHFVMRVEGESMNRRIPNGAWCLFKANSGGTREGKIVIVEHRSILDPDTGSRFTIKRYHSEKTRSGDDWRHLRIVLTPESSDDRYVPIVIENAPADELRVVAELIAVLG